jgi:hypothetical protein
MHHNHLLSHVTVFVESYKNFDLGDYGAEGKQKTLCKDMLGNEVRSA